MTKTKVEYRSISSIIEKLIPSSISLESHNKTINELILEEHYQIVYIMYILEKKPIPQIALVLNCSIDKVLEIVNSNIFYKMKNEKWKPAYLCSDVNIVNYLLIEDILDSLDDIKQNWNNLVNKISEQNEDSKVTTIKRRICRKRKISERTFN